EDRISETDAEIGDVVAILSRPNPTLIERKDVNGKVTGYFQTLDATIYYYDWPKSQCRSGVRKAGFSATANYSSVSKRRWIDFTNARGGSTRYSDYDHKCVVELSDAARNFDFGPGAEN